ncbi:MAG: SDR family oxidoreductase [Armatimonadota bacterium]
MSCVRDKTVLITGASKGIGKAIAELFAENGGKISACARSIDNLTELCNKINSNGGNAVPIFMDLEDEESIKSAVKKTKKEFGKIDILINNAAVFALSKISEMDTATWDKVMNINLKGLFITCREVLPDMMVRKEGRIINIGSMAGRRGYEEQGAYCAGKHALVGFSKVLAIETQKYNIKVNLLSPGGVLTELSSGLRAARGEKEDSPEWMTAEEVAEAALYLCSQTGAAFTDELVLRRFASEPWR